MDFTQFNSLSKEVRTDIALCALIKLLTGQLTKHLMVMERQGKDINAFVATHETLINEIASDANFTVTALKTLIED